MKLRDAPVLIGFGILVHVCAFVLVMTALGFLWWFLPHK
jgi:hypothetical protein